MGWGVKLTGLDATTDGLEQMVEASEMTTYTVASGVEYSVYVEFGTSTMPANGALRQSTKETMSNLGSVISGADSIGEITQLIAEDIAAGWRKDVWVDTGRLKRSIHVEAVG